MINNSNLLIKSVYSEYYLVLIRIVPPLQKSRTITNLTMTIIDQLTDVTVFNSLENKILKDFIKIQVQMIYVFTTSKLKLSR